MTTLCVGFNASGVCTMSIDNVYPAVVTTHVGDLCGSCAIAHGYCESHEWAYQCDHLDHYAGTCLHCGGQQATCEA
jgi:hypothetical protein